MDSRPSSLLRSLGLVPAIAIILANVIGTGVFLKARVMTEALGSPGWVMAAWVAAGLLSLAGALTYAELASMMPRTGGELAYLEKGYGRVWGFLFGWTQVLVAKTGSQASAAVACGIFLNAATGGKLSNTCTTLTVGSWQHPITWVQVVAVGMIVLVTLLNLASVQANGRIATTLSVVKLLLVLFVGIGAFILAPGSWEHFSESSPTHTGGSSLGFASGFAAAMLAALWAYDGWNSVTYVAGEIRRPQRNLPLSLFGGTLLIMMLYVMVNAAYFYVLTPQEIVAVSPASSVANEVAIRFLGAGAMLVMTLGLFASSFGTLHSSALTGARIPYAMARSGNFWKPFARVSKSARIPVLGLLAQSLWACLLALSGSFDTLTDYVVFGSWIFYGMAGSVVFILRRKEPLTERPYRVWGYPIVPAIFLLTTLWLLIQTLRDGTTSSLIGLGIIAAGLPVYALFFRQRPNTPWQDAADH